MKIKFNRALIFLAILSVFILSLGMVSASEDGLNSDYSIADSASSADSIASDLSSSSDSVSSDSISTDSYITDSSQDNSDLKNNSYSKSTNPNTPQYGVSTIPVVRTGDDAKDIQTAINTASSGDVVDLGVGEYNVGYAQINITKKISFLGAGDTVIRGYGCIQGYENESDTSVVYISAANVAVEGIIFENINPNLEYTDWDTLYGWALKVGPSASNVSIDKCSFINFNHGVYCEANYLTVTNSYFNGTTTRLYTSYNTGGKERGTKCVHLDECNNALIANNTFEGPVLDAILVEYGSSNTRILDNQFINNSYSIYLYGISSSYQAAYGTLIANNSFTDCGHFEAPNFKDYTAIYTYLPIIDAEDTYLYDVIVTENTFNLRNDSIVFLGPEGSEYIYGGVEISNNNFYAINENVDPNTIFLFSVYSLIDELDLEFPLFFEGNNYIDGMYVALFEDYYGYGSDYWVSYFGDLIVPSNTGTFTELKVNATTESLNAGDSNLIVFNLTDQYDNPLDESVRIVILTDDDIETHDVTTVNGIGSYRISNLLQGSYYVYVAYGGSISYYPIMDGVSFNVSGKPSNLAINTNDIVSGEIARINFTLVDNDFNGINGNLIVNIHNDDFDKNYTVIVSRGSGTLSTKDLVNQGEYAITAVFEGNDEYMASNASSSIYVTSKESSLKITAPESIISGESFTLNISLTDLNDIPLNGSVYLSINQGREKEITVSRGKGSLEIDSLVEVGEYYITVTYNGDKSKVSSADSAIVSVLPRETRISISSVKEEELYNGGLYNLSIGLSSNNRNIAGAVAISIDGEFFDLLYVNGENTFLLELDEAGNYTIFANYYGDTVYAPSSSSYVLEVDGESEYILINHTGNDVLDIQKAIDSAEPGDIINLGSYNYQNISNLNITSDIVIISENANIFTSNDASPVFIVRDDISEFIVDGITFTLNSNNDIVYFESEDSCNVFFEISNNEFIAASPKVQAEEISLLLINSTSDDIFENGVIILNNTLVSGMKTLTVLNTKTDESSDNSSGDSSGDSNETAPVVLRQSSQILCENMTTNAINTVLDGRNGEYFNFQLVDSNGKALANKMVYVGFNGHVYNYTTDANGSAKTQINLGVKGGYTFAICFLGDDEYNASFSVAKITVEPEPVKLTTAQKTYKASAKTKTLTATFKTSRGSAISGKKITFTVNGKSYTGTTNSNGIATVKVSLSKKGTYSFTAKFAGDERYKATAVKSTLKIS